MKQCSPNPKSHDTSADESRQYKRLKLVKEDVTTKEGMTNIFSLFLSLSLSPCRPVCPDRHTQHNRQPLRNMTGGTPMRIHYLHYSYFTARLSCVMSASRSPIDAMARLTPRPPSPPSFQFSPTLSPSLSSLQPVSLLRTIHDNSLHKGRSASAQNGTGRTVVLVTQNT